MATRQELANALRALAMDAVQKASSGHPGMPMGMAEIAEVLWNNHLRFNPGNPAWPDRDRFVLSNGHGSMLLYALLHLTGFDLPMKELERFRQLHSKTPGHPEHGLAPGVETTTGPLGQGLANAVGMAIAERVLATGFNRPGFEIVNHHTYVFVGDGCLMEGISHEACSLAGTLGLGKLIALYDDNGISIDGHVQGWFTDDTPKRFQGYGWHVIPDVDGHSFGAVHDALVAARAVSDRPSLICCKTVIGKGAPNKADSHDAHGSPLGEKEVAATRENIGWKYPPFEIPREVYEGWDARVKGTGLEKLWSNRFAEYAREYPELAAEFERRTAGKLPADWQEGARALVARTQQKAESIATRKASQNALEALGPGLPELIGGSADLAASNLTLWSGSRPLRRGDGGNYIFYGVREFAMSAIMNGLALHGGLIPYGGTFLTFSDYARNALRMAALMKIGSIFVYTHDSIGLGEDGPTHQSIEHAATLRLIPEMEVWRPCDTTETALAWIAAIERRHGPTALLLSRQNLAFVARSDQQLALIRRGGYVLSEAAGSAPKVVLIATGSEVGLALESQKALASEGLAARVVSMPCTSLFDRQEQSYRDAVLPRGVRRVAIEAGVTDYWRKYVGLEGGVVGIDRFGESAPAGDLFKYFGFTVANVVDTVKRTLRG
jgi:transketolase